MQSDSTATSDIDFVTAASVGVVAYCLTNLIHEGLGHGGACLIVGGKPEVLNAVFFSCNDAGMTMASKRALVAGGSLANLLVAWLSAIALRSRRRQPGALHYFLWLMLALNLLMPFGYLGFSGMGGFGDWAVFVEGLGPPLVLRGSLVLLGGFLYFWVAPKIIVPRLNVYLGRDRQARQQRARKLSLYPYLIGGTCYVIAGLFNPYGWKLVLLSAAAASFGGTSFLAWGIPGHNDALSLEAAPEVPAAMPRSLKWWAIAVVTLAIFVGVFGPGVHF